MELTSIFLPATILGGIGLVLGTAIAVVNRVFWVWEDPRIGEAEEMLPEPTAAPAASPDAVPSPRR